MYFGLLIDRFNNPNKNQEGRMIPKEYSDKVHNPVKLNLDVAPVIEKSVELVKPFFTDRWGMPLIMYDTTHGGGFGGFVIPHEEFKSENGISSNLESRISFEGMPDDNGVVSSENLSRVHLSVFARRSFPPKNYRSLLKSLPADKRENAVVSEIVNVSLRWTSSKTSTLEYERVWENPTVHQSGFAFHLTRSSYYKSFPVFKEDSSTGPRRNPASSLSPDLSVLPSGSEYGDFRRFISKKIDGDVIPLIGLNALSKTLPGFPESPLKFRERGFPKPDEAPEYLFGEVLPYLSKFIDFKE